MILKLFNPVLNQRFKIIVSENKTNIDGLLFEPQIKTVYMSNLSDDDFDETSSEVNKIDNIDNNDEYAPFLSCTFPHEVSPQNYELVKQISKNYMTHGVIEIGVHRNGYGSFTHALLSNKPDGIPYLGIDIDDKSFLNDKVKNIFTIQENSFNQDKVREYISEVGIDKVSILFIDGDHSVNACINDWKYTDLLSENGIVILHDTNYHPGSFTILSSIDSSKYKIEKFFENQHDYGVAVAYKLK
jgi:hypothetical protein